MLGVSVVTLSIWGAACASPNVDGDALDQRAGANRPPSNLGDSSDPGGGSSGAPLPGSSGDPGSTSGGTSGTPSDPRTQPSSDGASVVSVTIPSSLIIGDGGDATVTVKNTGTTLWSAGSGYALGTVTSLGAKILVDVALPANVTVPAGASYTFTFRVTAVAEGSYTAAWRMKKGATLFGDTASKPVVVKPDPSLMVADNQLGANQYRESRDGRFRFYYQGDGNAVLYRTGGAALWASNTAGTTTGRLIMQGDGNLVVYNAANTPIWASNTVNNPGSRLIVQNDGNVVIYSSANVALWATNTGGQ